MLSSSSPTTPWSCWWFCLWSRCCPSLWLHIAHWVICFRLICCVLALELLVVLPLVQVLLHILVSYSSSGNLNRLFCRVLALELLVVLPLVQVVQMLPLSPGVKGAA